MPSLRFGDHLELPLDSDDVGVVTLGGRHVLALGAVPGGCARETPGCVRETLDGRTKQDGGTEGFQALKGGGNARKGGEV